MDVPFTPRLLLLIVAVPAALIVILGVLSWQIWRRGGARGYWAAPLGIAASIVFAFPHITGAQPGWPARETTGWIDYIAVAAGLIGLLDALIRLPLVVRCILAYLLSFGAMALMLKYKLANDTISKGQFFAAVSALSVIGLLWWVAFERSTVVDGRINAPLEPRRSVMAPLLMWMTATTGALAISMNGGLTFGQFDMTLAGSAGGMGVVSLLRPQIRWQRGAAFAFCPTMLSTIVAAHYLIPLTRLLAVSITFPLLAVPIFILLGRLVSIPVQSPRWRTTIRIAALAIPLGITVAFSIRSFLAKQAADKDDPYSMYSPPSPAQLAWPTYSDGQIAVKAVRFRSTSPTAAAI